MKELIFEACTEDESISIPLVLEYLTTRKRIDMVSSMKALSLIHRRVIVATDVFVEVVIWQIPEPLSPSPHLFKYSLAYVVEQQCVLRYDNERGKGDHRHFVEHNGEEVEEPYTFSSPDQLMIDFERAIARWNHEHGRT